MNLKKLLPWLLAAASAFLLVGCASTATFTRMDPSIQPRNANNLYPVEVGFYSAQQSMRPDSIKAYVIVNGNSLPIRRVPMVSDRWEGLVPVPPGQDSIKYRFKFDYLYNAFGSAPKQDSSMSPVYTLNIIKP